MKTTIVRAYCIRPLLAASLALAIAFTIGCEEKSGGKAADNQAGAAELTVEEAAEAATESAKAEDAPKPSDEKLLKLIPAGYSFHSEEHGDLNGDKTDDLVLVIQSSDNKRRGVMVYFKEASGYKLAAENRRFFTPNNYCCQWNSPGISVSVKKGSLHISYDYGGCGTWKDYNFKYRNSDFELIGFDWNTCVHIDGDIRKEKISVNFLSKKQLNTVSGKEVWSDIVVKEPITLQSIEDLDEFDVMEHIASVAVPFTDTRDGKTYKTVIIGEQTWMAENLNYKPPTGNSWCYDNKESNCKVYGRLYDWNTAMKACPAGWHLPSRAEWEELAKAAGGTGEDGGEGEAGRNLKTTAGWSNYDGEFNGVDSFGFSALPGGGLWENDFAGVDAGYWWTATEMDSDNAYLQYMSDFPELGIDNRSKSRRGFSVRCLKDKGSKK